MRGKHTRRDRSVDSHGQSMLQSLFYGFVSKLFERKPELGEAEAERGLLTFANLNSDDGATPIPMDVVPSYAGASEGGLALSAFLEGSFDDCEVVYTLVKVSVV
jgi:hypothetical protein